MSKVIIVHPQIPSRLVKQKIAALIQAFLSGRNALTIRAYRQDLNDFSTFTRSSDVDDAARGLLSLAPGDANALALGYKANLVERGLQASTINRRLAALRAMVKLARTLGIVVWNLEVQNLKVEHDRDLRGPARGTLKKVLHDLKQCGDGKARRDLAILRLLHDLGLRRGEVVSLDLAHVALEAGTLSIKGKGRTTRMTLTLPDETAGVLTAWIAARGTAPGPLFTNFDRAGKGARLTGTSVYRLTRGLGLGRPHGVRHLAITEALDLLGGDVRKVQRFSRHRDLRVLNVYDDNRQDLAGEVARIVAANL
ncbi:MAG: site-specific integrase [Elusimicrobia bacterium]|nr:site-specific integrase [Elusimicrobiota bacterium]